MREVPSQKMRIEVNPGRSRGNRQLIDEGLVEHAIEQKGEHENTVLNAIWDLISQDYDHSWYSIQQELEKNVPLLREASKEDLETIIVAMCWKYLDERDYYNAAGYAQESIRWLASLPDARISEHEFDDMLAENIFVDPGRVVWLGKTFQIDLVSNKERKGAIDEGYDIFTRNNLRQAGYFDARYERSNDDEADPLSVVEWSYKELGEPMLVERFQEELEHATGVALERGDIDRADRLIEFGLKEGGSPELNASRQASFLKAYKRHEASIQKGYVNMIDDRIREVQRGAVAIAQIVDDLSQRLGMRPDWENQDIKEGMRGVMQWLVRVAEFWPAMEISHLCGLELSKEELAEHATPAMHHMLAMGKLDEIEQLAAHFGLSFKMSALAEQAIDRALDPIFTDPNSAEGDFYLKRLDEYRAFAPGYVTDRYLEQCFAKSYIYYSPFGLAGVLSLLERANVGLEWVQTYQEDIVEKCSVARLEGDEQTASVLMRFCEANVPLEAHQGKKVANVLINKFRRSNHAGFEELIQKAKSMGVYTPEVQRLLSELVEKEYEDLRAWTGHRVGISRIQSCLLVGPMPPEDLKERFGADVEKECISLLGYGSMMTTSVFSEYQRILAVLGRKTDWQAANAEIQRNAERLLGNGRLEEIYFIEQQTGVRVALDRTAVERSLREKMENVEGGREVVQSVLWDRFKEEIQSTLFTHAVAHHRTRSPQDGIEELARLTGKSIPELVGNSVKIGLMRELASVPRASYEDGVTKIVECCTKWEMPAEVSSIEGEEYAEARLKRGEGLLKAYFSGATADVSDKYSLKPSKERRSEILCEVLSSATGNKVEEVLRNAKKTDCMDELNVEPLRTAIKAGIAKAFAAGLPLTNILNDPGFDRGLILEIQELPQLTQALYSKNSSWEDILSVTGVKPDLRTKEVFGTWVKNLQRALEWRDAKMAERVWAMGESSPGRPSIRFSMFDREALLKIIKTSGFSEIEKYTGLLVTDEDVFSDLMKLRNKEVLTKIYTDRGGRLSESQRALFKATWQKIVLTELGTYPDYPQVLKEYEKLTEHRLEWERTPEQVDGIQKFYGSSHKPHHWRTVAEETQIQPDMTKAEVRKTWESIAFSTAGIQQWNELKEWTKWAKDGGWDGVWSGSDEMHRQLLGVVESMLLGLGNSDASAVVSFESTFGVSYRDHVGLILSRAGGRNPYPAHKFVEMCAAIEARSKADGDQSMLENLREAKRISLDRRVEEKKWNEVIEFVHAWGLKPRTELLQSARIAAFVSGNRSIDLDKVLQFTIGTEVTPEDFQYMPKDLTASKAARFYETSLPKSGIERARAVEYFRGSHPKYDCVADLLTVRGSSRREEFCPYVRIENLFRKLTNDGYSLEDPVIRKGVLLFAKQFGLEDLPLLCESVIDLQRRDGLPTDVEKAERMDDVRPSVRRVLELVGIKSEDTPERILQRLKEFQGKIGQILLQDQDLPVGFESNPLAMELFNAFVPHTGSYASTSGREGLITESRSKRGASVSSSLFLKQREMEVVTFDGGDESSNEQIEKKVNEIDERIQKKVNEEPFMTFLKPWREGMRLASVGVVEPEWWLGRVQARWEAQKTQMGEKLKMIQNEKGRIGQQNQIDALTTRLELLQKLSADLYARERVTDETHFGLARRQMPEDTLRCLQQVFVDDKGRVDSLALSKAASEEVFGLMYALMRTHAPPHIQAIETAETEKDPIKIAEVWTKYFFEEYLEHFTREGEEQIPQDLVRLAHTLWKTKGIADSLREVGLNKEGGARHPIADVGRAVNALRGKKERMLRGEAVTESTKLGIYPVMRVGRALSGDIANACFNRHSQDLINGKYPKLTSLLFKIESETELAGSTLCIDTKNVKGERVLVIRALNPTEAVVRRKLDAESAVKACAQYFIDAAEASAGVSGDQPVKEVHLCYDHRGGHSTNRQDVFDVMTKLLTTGEWKDAPASDGLENIPETNFNDYGIWRAGETRVLWRRKDDVMQPAPSVVETV